MIKKTRARRILIVGGVAGGASAAARARRMNEDAEIIIFEKDRYVSFANCGLPYYVGGEIEDRNKLVIAGPELFENRFKIQVKVRHEVISVDRQEKVIKVLNHETGEVSTEPYDRLILATGASPFVPPMQGKEAPNAFTMRNLEDTDRIVDHLKDAQPKRALVVGAGFIGLEMVEQLHHRGVKTTLVELADQVLTPLDAEMAHMVSEELEAKGIQLKLGTLIQDLELDDSGAIIAAVTKAGERIETDMVILSIGVRPNIQLAQNADLSIHESGAIEVDAMGRTSDPAIYAVGDNAMDWHGVLDEPTRVPLGGPANRAGRVAGEHAAVDHASPIPAVMGTAIVRVFDKSAAVTGLSEKAALKKGLKVRQVIVSGGHHAGYYPGAQSMVMKLIYDDRGQIFGAQAVGGEGVDKRMDVIATLLHFKGSVDDLASMDLCYAPPFGSAKDVLHMAAFAAQNDLRGISPLLKPKADLSDQIIVDVRSPQEFERAALDGAKNISLESLRDRLDELDPTQSIVVICQGGLRGHVATRILIENGFTKVKNLTGGMLLQAHL